MLEKTFEELDTFYFRKYKLKATIQELLDDVNGRNIKIKPLIEDEIGRFSIERTVALTDALVDCLSTYVNYRTPFKDTPGRKSIMDPVEGFEEKISEQEVLSERRRAFFSSFITCAVMNLRVEEDPDLTRIIELVSGAPVYKSYEELLASQFRKGPLRFFTDTLKEGGYDDERDRFELYSKGTFNDGIPYRGDYITFFARSSYINDSSQNHGRIADFRYQMMASEDEMDEMLDEIGASGIDVPAAWISEYEAKKGNFSEYVPGNEEQEMFERAYRTVLYSQNLATSPAVFEDTISGMIDVFAMRCGGALMTDANGFYRVYDRIGKAGVEASALKSSRKEV